MPIDLKDGRTLLTSQEVAAILEVSDGRVWHFVTDGRLVPVDIIGRRLFVECEVKAFAAKRLLGKG